MEEFHFHSIHNAKARPTIMAERAFARKSRLMRWGAYRGLRRYPYGPDACVNALTWLPPIIEKIRIRSAPKYPITEGCAPNRGGFLQLVPVAATTPVAETGAMPVSTMAELAGVSRNCAGKGLAVAIRAATSCVAASMGLCWVLLGTP